MRITTPTTGLFQSTAAKTGEDGFPANLFASLFKGLRGETSDSPESASEKTDPLVLSRSGQSARLDVLRQSLNQHLDTFRSRLREALSAADIDSNHKIELDTDSFGQIRSTGHPQNAAIEDLFENNPELRSLFHVVAASANYLDGHDNSPRDFEVSLDDGKFELGFR